MPANDVEPVRSSRVRPILVVTAEVIAWLSLWRLSALLEYAPHASIWFPPAALTFALLLVRGLPALPSVLISAVLATFWENGVYETQLPTSTLIYGGVLFGIAHVGAYGSSAWLMRRLLQRSSHYRLPQLVIMLLLLLVSAALVAAISGSAALAISGIAPGGFVAAQILPWWVGDLIGAVVLSPLLIALIGRLYPRHTAWLDRLGLRLRPAHHELFVLKLAVCLALLASIMITSVKFAYPEIALAVFFLSVPQMWIAYTETPFRAAISLAILSTATVIGIRLMGFGDHVLIYQFAVNVLAANTYFGFLVPTLISDNRLLREMTRIDDLTGAASRTYFMEQAEAEVTRATRHGTPVSLLLFDVDHFKQINDRFGHLAGDEALCAAATAVQRQLRKTDIFGRFGGDEFMLLLPGISADAAHRTAERLRQLLSSVSICEGAHRLSCSFGVTEVDAQETLLNAFNRCDANLFRAKQAGRNCVSGDEHLSLPLMLPTDARIGTPGDGPRPGQ